MSKYDALWRWIRENGAQDLTLSFEDIRRIAGVPIDHAFLTYKKELAPFGYEVKKISLKQQTVRFQRMEHNEQPMP